MSDITDTLEIAKLRHIATVKIPEGLNILDGQQFAEFMITEVSRAFLAGARWSLAEALAAVNKLEPGNAG
jgi:hypothetical protein